MPNEHIYFKLQVLIGCTQQEKCKCLHTGLKCACAVCIFLQTRTSNCTETALCQTLGVHLFMAEHFWEILLHELTMGRPFSPPFEKILWSEQAHDEGLENFELHWKGWGWIEKGRQSIGLYSIAWMDVSNKCAFHKQHSVKTFCSVLFPCLALTNKVYQSNMENLSVFVMFYSCLRFDRLNYCKHRLCLSSRHWMENPICCWTVLDWFGQMLGEFALVAFKNKKAVKNGLLSIIF